MRILFILIFLFPALLTAQEKYFHELKGMEDSTGTTHLFYRMFEKIPYQCPEEETGELIYNVYDNVNHINTSSLTDSIKFNHYYEPWCLNGYADSEGVSDYDFYENDPDKWITQITYQGCFPFPVTDYNGRMLELPRVCLTKQKPVNNFQFENETGFILSNKEDSLYFNDPIEGGGFRVAIKEDFFPSLSVSNEEEYGFYYSYINSVGTEFGVGAIHPIIDSLFYTKNYSGHLLVSESYSSTFIPSDTTAAYYKLAFDSKPSVLYSIVSKNKDGLISRFLKKSSESGKANSWSFLVLPGELNRLQYLITDASRNGNLFIADSTTIFESIDFGSSFELISEMEYRITGLYKKPGSQILYVLTTDELYEVNTETKVVTSLKKLPVSNEEPEEIPVGIKLHQNYPNPFNPSTSISFELNQPTEVTLTVFDALGRTISVLMDEQRITGLHEVSFDASNLSSGIYFYQLSTGAFSETKRLILIK